MTQDRGILARRALFAAGGAGVLSLCVPPLARAAGAAGAPRGPVAGDDPRPARTRSAPGGTRAVVERTVAGGPMALALTFDDGPSPIYTPRVLAVLTRHRVRATFFMLGANVAKYPDTVRQVVDLGHVLGNHTWSHPILTALPAAEVRDQIERTNEVIARVGRAGAPVLFRAPGGHFAPAALQVCGELGMRAISWSVDPEDWSNPGTGTVVKRTLGAARTGSIILNHDGALSLHAVPEHQGLGDRSQTVHALHTVIPQLLDAGHHFTTPDTHPKVV
ncbi:polysaccharide deacetylase family protein [Streptomyces sp. NBC_00083]|uniref:polysaccharide deacetylase family protein n=1 Tax=Streptomyces sp. NBC_00083 TaxID=2975647 RepID=UPI0022537170|nr:polysaccharide deacetylase family protein [Streptomyces sp. NBC_00083]MCX5388136.1 polysaccharide deacetylase family protein [Streptomyces sp. NBC_00083]